MNNTIYLVTGGAGFLGGNVCRTLIKRGDHVRTLALPNDPAARYIPDGAEVFFGDITNKDSLRDFFAIPAEKKAVVIHCASIVALSPEPSRKVFDVNVAGTSNIIDLCLENEAEKLVYVSSTGAIPELPHGQTISEPENFRPDAVIGYYSKTKALATMSVLDAVKNRNLNASIIYPTGICGPFDYSFGFVANFILEYCSGKMPVGVEGSFNSVDVRDLAAAVVACADKGRNGEGYILGNEMVSMERMFELISKYSSAPLVESILAADTLLAATGAKLPDGPEKEKTLAALKFCLYNMIRNNRFSSKKAEKELDYKPRPFEDTISDEVSWLIKVGKLRKHTA